MSARKRFRELIAAPGMVHAPGAYDALSARIIEAQGFDVVAETGPPVSSGLAAIPIFGAAARAQIGNDLADQIALVADGQRALREEDLM